MSGFPLLLIPLAICNIVAFLMRDVKLDVQLFAVPLMSGASWTVTFGDALLALGLFLLLLEIQKSARPGGKYVTDHLLSLVIFGGAAAEFLMLPQFANSTFFLLTLIALVDFLSGLGLRARRPRRIRDTALAPAPPPPVPAQEPLPRPVVTAPPPVATVPPSAEPIIDTPRDDPPEAPARPAGTVP